MAGHDWPKHGPAPRRIGRHQSSWPGPAANTKEPTMGKGNNARGNKEAKKPKQEKPKVLATANSNAGKPLISPGKKAK